MFAGCPVRVQSVQARVSIALEADAELQLE